MAATKRRLLAEEEKLLGLEETKSRCLRELQEKQAKGIRALDISLYSDFIGRVTTQIAAQRKTISGIERSLAKKTQKTGSSHERAKDR